MTKKVSREVFVLLHDIRSTYNVGSIFRTSDAFRVNKIFISGYTPSPLDKYGRWRKDIAKVSLGAEKSVKWEVVKSHKKLINDLKKKGVSIVSIEQGEKSVDYKKVKLKSSVLFVIGNEVSGVDSWILENSDILAEIPMLGEKESLNVSVAYAVALSRILNI